jgi:hypothetical protein
MACASTIEIYREIVDRTISSCDDYIPPGFSPVSSFKASNGLRSVGAGKCLSISRKKNEIGAAPLGGAPNLLNVVVQLFGCLHEDCHGLFVSISPGNYWQATKGMIERLESFGSLTRLIINPAKLPAGVKW